MISSRRLAREWALKILYQKDVGKVPAQEALDTALERLRLEFVQRGSRTASGSTAELVCLEVVTADLRDVLDGLPGPLERALATVAARLVQELPYWQELRIDRLFREPASILPPTASRRLLMRHVAQAFGLTEGEVATLPGLLPPRLSLPQPEAIVLSNLEGIAAPGSATASATGAEADLYARLVRFAHRVREQLPVRLEDDFRRTGITFIRDLVRQRPSELGAVSNSELTAYLRTQREAFVLAQTERWRKVGEIVEKQTADWLRTAEFAARLVRGVEAHQKEIDATISALSSGWNMDRQVAVDRNILRLGGFEIMFMEAVPTAASINEAVELAKKYSTAESGRFVNGVLGALATKHGTPDPPRKSSGHSSSAIDTDEAGEADTDPLSDDPNDLLDLPDDLEDMGDTDDELDSDLTGGTSGTDNGQNDSIDTNSKETTA